MPLFLTDLRHSEVLEEYEDSETVAVKVLALEAFEECMRNEVKDIDEEDSLKRAILNVEDAVMDAAYQRCHVKLMRAKREKQEFLEVLEEGGQTKKRNERYDVFQRCILAD